ncbi:MAG: site-specific integrase [Methanolinea sp.]|jgi:site-specific recombinase XerD
MTARTPRAIDNDAFYRIKSDYPDRSIANGLKAGILNDRDISLIKAFVAEMQASRNTSLKRAHKFTYTLVGWRRFIGPFDQNDMVALYAGIAALKSGTSKRGKPFMKNTITDHMIILKQFYLWLIENGYSQIPEKKLRNLRPPNHETMTKVASDLLTPEEITAMVRACTRSCDRAVIMMLYEGGFRIGEIGMMRWGDLIFDKWGVVVNVNFKTNKPRYIRLVMAREYLASWKNDYPCHPMNPEMPVFITEHYNALTHGSINLQLKRIARRAGIQKRITPHIFRHSRITHIIKDGVSESVIKLMMWGSLTTDMFQTYAHLTGKDIDSEILRTYGINENETGEAFKERRLEPIQCVHCRHINAPMAGYCNLCGRSLTEEATESDDEIHESILRNPASLKRFVQKLEARAAKGEV